MVRRRPAIPRFGEIKKGGNPWYFGMRVHVNTNRRGLIHTITTTDAATADITQLLHLLHGQDISLHGGKACYQADDEVQWEVSGGRYLVNKCGKRTDYWGYSGVQDLIAGKDFWPAQHMFVLPEQDRAAFVAGGDEAEEEIRVDPVDGTEAHFVDHEQPELK